MRTDVSGTVDVDGGKVGVSVDGSGASANASVDGEFSRKVIDSHGVGLSFGISSEAKATTEVKADPGTGKTTYAAEAEASVTLNADASLPGGKAGKVGVGVEHTEGIKASYTVTMPFDQATTENIAKANPFDPTSMPVGTAIGMEQSYYTNNAFSATFKGITAKLGGPTLSEGSAFSVTKADQNSVTVTTGPTSEMKGGSFGFSKDVAGGELSVDIGGPRYTSKESTFQSATFDLSTQAGREAYSNFLATGEMPEQNGTGISDVKTISTLKSDYESLVPEVSWKKDGTTIAVGGGMWSSSPSTYVTTTYPDGSKTATIHGESQGVQLDFTQKFAADGTEDLQARQYSYTFTLRGDEGGRITANLLNRMITGSTNGPIQPGEKVTLAFSNNEMQQLLAMGTQRFSKPDDHGRRPDNHNLDPFTTKNNSPGQPENQPITEPFEFAAALGSVNGDLIVYRINQVLWNPVEIARSSGAGPTHAQPLAGTVTVNGEIVLAGDAAKAAAAPPPVSTQEQAYAVGGGRLLKI